MKDLIIIGLGLVIGGFIGFNVGAQRVVDKAEVAAQNFIDALRYRFGSVVEREVEVGEDEFGNPEVETVEFVELPEDLEDLGAELFNLE